ncbi:VanZ family protein [Pontibacillus marinus]|uniref:VanZ family protein n=1 Tax=Pontibacillus marinus BH030004 = DSM 16465 TaxID=1385511 RepID=A0A0A5GCU2_9BACI|nr:VanZ family protein [Pontibacillus marinus]KGX91006.1 VanZ family protein [Pontibacillus marinus BH030004 = DSM 16465]
MNKILSWTSVILWLLLIFYFSHQPATESKRFSTEVTKSVVETAQIVAPEKEIDVGDLHHIVRKNAHFFLYFVLGVLVLNALRFSWRAGKGLLIGGAFLFCIFYALSDEFHQVFVPGRGAQLSDVFIDSAGAGVGIVLYVVTGIVKTKYSR